ncbi:MAG: hypothetical protein V1688_00140 [bacterium]
MTINIKLKYSYIIKTIYGLVAIIFIVAAYLLLNFLDINFYQVITQAEDIIVLRKEVSNEVIDAALFEKILAHLNEKQKPLPFDVKNVKDIFNSPLPEQSGSGEQNFNSPSGIPSPNGM